MKKLVCAMLLILSVGYAIDEEQLNIECRDFQDSTACKKIFFYTKSLCDKGDDRSCFNMGITYSTGKYGIAKNDMMALEYLKPLCDKGYNEINTCFIVGLIYYNMYSNNIFVRNTTSQPYFDRACVIYTGNSKYKEIIANMNEQTRENLRWACAYRLKARSNLP